MVKRHFQVQRRRHSRPFRVTIDPERQMFEVHEKGRRQTHTVPLETVCELVVSCVAKALAAEANGARPWEGRKVKRGLVR